MPMRMRDSDHCYGEVVRVASTGSLTLSAPGTTIDGVTMAVGDLVLVKNQGTTSDNGIYVFQTSATAMLRMNTIPLPQGGTIWVTAGTANISTLWRIDQTGPIVPGQTGLTFTQLYPPVVTKTVRTVHTFAIKGNVISTDTVPGFFFSKATSQTSNVVKARYKIASGTNTTFKIQKNGADWTGYGTTGSPLTATTTAATTTQTNALAEDDLITLVLVGVSGTPVDLSVTVVMEHVV